MRRSYIVVPRRVRTLLPDGECAARKSRRHRHLRLGSWYRTLSVGSQKEFERATNAGSGYQAWDAVLCRAGQRYFPAAIGQVTLIGKGYVIRNIGTLSLSTRQHHSCTDVERRRGCGTNIQTAFCRSGTIQIASTDGGYS